MKRVALAAVDENVSPPKKKLSLSLKKKPEKRFGSFVTEEEQTVAAKGVVPLNTKIANDWAMKNLRQWMEHRNNSGEEKVPDDLLCCKDAERVCKWLCIFVQETQKENGEEYPPSTIRALIAAFQRQMTENKLGFNLLDKTDLRFRDLRNTLDTLCVSLRKKGLGATRKHAAVISIEDEKLMWESGVLGEDNPWCLVRAAFYVVGLHFCLRGGEEHRNLTVCQLRRFPNDGSYSSESYYDYVEHGSKNHQGKFNEMDSNKVSRAYAQPKTGKCPVRILDLYISKLPSNPKAFYMQPLQVAPVDQGKAWYKTTPMGVNTLKNMMPRVSELAGLRNRYTNHSLRATAATRMFASGVPEKVIAEFTGHKSSKALHVYERTTTEQVKAAGLAISELGSSIPNATVPDDEIDVKPDLDKIEKALPTFSGNLSGCTITINL